jgi:hypothetical protein
MEGVSMAHERTRAQRLFPELRQGASLRWFVFQFEVGGPFVHDVPRAIVARTAGQFVRLTPREMGALHWLNPAREPPVKSR